MEIIFVFIIPLILFVGLHIIYLKYKFRSGTSYIVVLDNDITTELKTTDKLNFLLIYMNKKEVNPTNIIALIKELSTDIDTVKVETNSAYNIRIKYVSTIADFNEKADSFRPEIKKIVEKENLRSINNKKLVKKFER